MSPRHDCHLCEIRGNQNVGHFECFWYIHTLPKSKVNCCEGINPIKKCSEKNDDQSLSMDHHCLEEGETKPGSC